MVSIHRHKKILKRLGVPADLVDKCQSNTSLDELKKEYMKDASNGLNSESNNQG